MKFVPFLLCSFLAMPLWAQYSQDSLKQNTDSPQEKERVSELFTIGKKAYKTGASTPMERYIPFSSHWKGFHYGFVNFAKLPDDWKELELDWGNSFAMQFNVGKCDINFSKRNNFGLALGLGLEYQRLKFNNDNVSIQKTDGKLEITHPLDNPDADKITKSTFKNLYITVPLMLEVQFPAKFRKRLYVSGGVMGGLRVHSKTKVVYDDANNDKHKRKAKGNFNLVPFKADAIARIGYRAFNIWGSYTLTNMFKADDGFPKLHPYTIGIGLTIP